MRLEELPDLGCPAVQLVSLDGSRPLHLGIDAIVVVPQNEFRQLLIVEIEVSLSLEAFKQNGYDIVSLGRFHFALEGVDHNNLLLE